MMMHEKFEYVVDGKPQSTTMTEMTVTEILEKAGGNPELSYLVEIEGDRRESFHGRPHHVIKMRNGLVFEMEHHTFHIEVDGEVEVSRDATLTPREIMKRADVDPERHYLKVLKMNGHPEESYRDRPDEPIHLRQNQAFATVAMTPTPVS
jgi:hypothetical protein